MELTREQIRAMADAIGLEVPEADLNNVTLRLSAALTAMQQIERELGEEMDKTEPIPPVFDEFVVSGSGFKVEEPRIGDPSRSIQNQ